MLYQAGDPVVVVDEDPIASPVLWTCKLTLPTLLLMDSWASTELVGDRYRSYSGASARGEVPVTASSSTFETQRVVLRSFRIKPRPGAEFGSRTY